MKQTTGKKHIPLSSPPSPTTDKFIPRVAKLDKHKYAAWVDTHIGATCEMALSALRGRPVRICSKRKLARQAALELVALACKYDQYDQTSKKP